MIFREQSCECLRRIISWIRPTVGVLVPVGDSILSVVCLNFFVKDVDIFLSE